MLKVRQRLAMVDQRLKMFSRYVIDTFFFQMIVVREVFGPSVDIRGADSGGGEALAEFIARGKLKK